MGCGICDPIWPLIMSKLLTAEDAALFQIVNIFFEFYLELVYLSSIR